MSTSSPGATRRGDRSPLLVAMAGAAAVPGLVLRFGGLHISPPVDALLFGVAIVGAAFLLSWAAEAAQVDISAGLAIALLALVAVLPEYAVDFVFTAQGGAAYAQYGPTCLPPGSAEQSPCGLALANMTGANRILVGVGWALVVLLAAIRLRVGGADAGQSGGAGTSHEPGRPTTVTLMRTDSVPLVFLLVATLYSLTLPLRESITLVDTVVLVGIFVLYSIRVSKAPAEDPDLIGPSAWIGRMEAPRRRTGYIGLFVVSALIIVACAEPFADSLVETGTELGISQFFLVQWLAPLASEAPELLVAGLYAWQLKTTDALATLVSSKVNQWSLLVGTLPIVFAISAGSLHGLPVDAVQREELLITAAQSLFAVALLVTLSITVLGALSLLVLFLAQFVLAATLPAALQEAELLIVSGIYLVAAIVLFVLRRQAVVALVKDGFRTPYAELTESK
ncbi:sodium/calcium exchanger family protein [Actinomycetospora sp. NBRC 106375]|uniref:sodium:proton exchanger n=1 Tax=Actinomycetospora sp. NBRC 106375 TaxID=3032207 RepID=UPI0024A1ADE4|nr:sodium:proton exchanger [Actinomycetospora sp. NBRC 106375]GLZ45813.1 sodium/calcium exchanger family protein [Actinomycetospora sp. NBRC 106375]